MTRKDTVLHRLLKTKAIAVLREQTAGNAQILADALSGAGITTIEITLTTPGALNTIRSLADRTDILVGAGSVLSPEQARDAIQAGAQFYASPCFDSEVLDTALRAEIVAIPGALTPTEIHAAWKAGADIVKVFPMPAGGASYIRSILGPMPELCLAPSGGINAETCTAYLQAGAQALNIGSWLTPADDNVERRLSTVEERAGLLRKALEEFDRGGTTTTSAG